MPNPDTTLFFWMNDLAGRWWLVDEWWRFWANDYIVPSLLVGILAAGWFRGERHRRVAMLCALVALAVANIIVAGSNAIWFRPRPFTTFDDVTLLFYYPSDSSFPSNSAAVVWSLAWVIWRGERGKGKGETATGTEVGEGVPPLGRGGGGGLPLKVGNIALGGALLMGMARLWVGIHYPLDILGGAVIGILAGEGAWRARRWVGRGVDGLVRLARLLKLD